MEMEINNNERKNIPNYFSVFQSHLNAEKEAYRTSRN